MKPGLYVLKPLEFISSHYTLSSDAADAWVDGGVVAVMNAGSFLLERITVAAYREFFYGPYFRYGKSVEVSMDGAIWEPAKFRCYVPNPEHEITTQSHDGAWQAWKYVRPVREPAFEIHRKDGTDLQVLHVLDGEDYEMIRELWSRNRRKDLETSKY